MLWAQVIITALLSMRYLQTVDTFLAEVGSLGCSWPLSRLVRVLTLSLTRAKAMLDLICPRAPDFSTPSRLLASAATQFLSAVTGWTFVKIENFYVLQGADPLVPHSTLAGNRSD